MQCTCIPSERLLVAHCCAERGLRRRQTRDWHAEGRARNVIELGAVAEGHALRIAAVLAADAELDIRPRPATALSCNLDQRADAALIERHERIMLQDAALDVVRQESAGIVA